MRALLVILISASVVLGAHAADKEKPGALPPPPPPVDHGVPPASSAPPAKPDETAIPEPGVVITTKTKGEDRYEEYRLGGRLYMIKVTPKVGKPYYLVDNTGSGEFVRSEFAPKISPPMWIIKRF